MKRLLLIACVCLVSLSASHFAEALNVDQKQLSRIQKQIQENKAKIQPKKAKKKRAEQHLGKLSRELKYTQLRLKKARQKLNRAEQKKKKTKANLMTLAKDYAIKKSAFKNRLVEIYKNQSTGMAEFVFADAENFSQPDATYIMNHIISTDIEMIADLKQRHQKLESERRKLNKQAKNILSMKNEVAKRQNQLKSRQKKQKKVISILQKQITEIERQNRELEEASQRITSLIRKEGSSTTSYYGTGSYIKPVKGWISSRYGARYHPIFKRRIKHNGIDIAAPRGYKIRAADSGMVIVAGQKKAYKGYGKIVVIDHGRRKDGKLVSTFYAHQSRILVKKGDFVKKGDEIGWVGSTGYATGPHLHFELRFNGKPVDPLKYIKM